MRPLYGDEVEYSVGLLEYSDRDAIQSFTCGNERLDAYIKAEIFKDGELDTADGRHFKVTDKKDGGRKRNALSRVQTTIHYLRWKINILCRL